jgi:hypothetical protein
LLSGEVPFKKGSSIDTLLAHQDEPVPSLAQKCPALPVEIVQLIEAMLAKEPDERPTLAAVRAVIKRLKGTKIPTMTAAGLQMTPISSTPAFVDPATTPKRQFYEPPTRPKPQFVEPLTVQMPASFDPKAAFNEPQTGKQDPFFEPPTAKQKPFVEPPTARQDRNSRPTRPHASNPFGETPTQVAPANFDPKAAFAMDALAGLDEVRASASLTAPRIPTPVPGSITAPSMPAPASGPITTPRVQTPVDGSLPLPAPPMTQRRMDSQPGPNESLPYQSMHVHTPQTTLAGHSMPPQYPSRPPQYTTPLPGSIPPMYQQQHPGSMPPQFARASDKAPAQPSRSMRLLVIIIAAVVASTIGITIALLA